MQRPTRIVPRPGQESVWDYPRPPRVEPATRLVTILSAGEIVTRTDRALRVLKTAGAPTYYIPAKDIGLDLLRPAPGRGTWCEWKGSVAYFDLVIGDVVSQNAAWTYPRPTPAYEQLADHYSFYLSGRHRRLLPRRRTRPAPTGRFLRGLGNRRHNGSDKGRAGHGALVEDRLRSDAKGTLALGLLQRNLDIRYVR